VQRRDAKLIGPALAVEIERGVYVARSFVNDKRFEGKFKVGKDEVVMKIGIETAGRNGGG
jgi:hypothetical protein